MHILFRIGLFMIAALVVILIPMFMFLKEMAILLAVNTAIIGASIILIYLVVVTVYLKLGKSKAIAAVVVVICLFTSIKIYMDWREYQINKEFFDLTNSTPAEFNQTIEQGDNQRRTIVWEKYSFVIPKDGILVVKILSGHTPEELALTILDSSKNHVGFINDQGGLTLEAVKKGERYFVLIDGRSEGYSVELTME